MQKNYKILFFILFFISKVSFSQCGDSTMVIISQSQEDNDTMAYTSKQVLHFNQAERQTLDIRYSWLGTNWQPFSKDTNTYLFDTLNQSHEKFLWINNQWQPFILETWQYVNNTLPNGYLLQHWSGSSWIDSLRTVYTYDGSFNLLEKVNQLFSGAQWVNIDRSVNVYDTFGNMVDSTFEGYTNGLVRYGKRYIYFFNGLDDTLLVTSQKSNYDTTWINLTYNRMTYDSLHRVEFTEQLSWNGVQWINSIQSFSHYIGTTNQTDSIFTKYWNTLAMTWDLSQITTNLYDLNNHLTNSTNWHWDGYFWVESYRTVQTFFGSLLIYSSSDYFSDGNWEFMYYSNYYYDVHGHFIGANGESQGSHTDGDSNYSFDANGIYIGYYGWHSNEYTGDNGSSIKDIYYGAINGNTVYCDGGSTTLFVDSCPGATYLWSTGATTPSIIVTSPDLITVEVVYPNGYHTYTAPLFVEAQSSIIFSTTVDSVLYRCGSLLPALNYPGQVFFAYQWYKNDTLIPGMINSNFQSNYWSTHPTEGNYYLIATNLCGSDTSGITTIIDVVLPNDSVAIIGTVPFCNGDAVTLSAMPGYSYSWYPNNETSQSIVIYTGGYYRVMITDSNNCVITKVIKLSSFALPSIPVIYRDGPEIILNDSTFAHWFLNSNLIQGNYLHYLPTQSGYYHIVATNLFGCSSVSDSLYFDMNAFFAQAGLNKVICRGQSLMLGGNYTAYGGTPPYHYQWSPSTGLNNDTISNPELISDSTRDYIVLITDSVGNTISDTVHIQVNPVTIPTLSHAADPVCGGTYLSLTANPSGLGNYRWTKDSILLMYAYYNQINIGTGGIYQVEITNGFGCVGISTPDTITFFSPVTQPQLIPSGWIPVCSGDSMLLHFTPDTSLTYSWLLNDTLIQPLNDTSVYAKRSGYYKIIATSANGCTAVSISLVLMDSVLDVVISPSSTVFACPEDSIRFYTVNYPGYIYQWKLNSIDIVGANSSELLISTTGNYQVEVTGPAGCSGLSQSIHANVYLPITGSIVLRNDTLFLESTSPDFSNFSIYWYDAISNNFLGSGNFYVPQSNQQILVYIYNSYSGCSAVLPQYEFILCSIVFNTTAPACSNDSSGVINLQLTGQGPFQIQWADGDTNLTRSQLPPGIYTVQITDSTGCVDVASDTLRSISSVKIDSIQSIVNCAGLCDDSLVTWVSGETGSVLYNWNTGALTSYLSGVCTGLFTITIVDSQGCVAIDSINYTEPLSFSASSSVTNTSCIGCSNGSVHIVITSGSSPYLYSWQPNVGNLNGDTISNLPTGIYQITISDAAGCELTFVDTILDDPLAVGSSINEKGDYFFSPNPFYSSTTLISKNRNTEGKCILIIRDNLSRTVREIKITSEKTILYKGELSPGVYSYIIIETNDVVLRGKLVVE